MNKLYDIWFFAKTLTFSKILNYFHSKVSFLISSITKKYIFNHYPVNLAIEPTTACNLECPECPSGLKQFSRATGNLKFDNFKKTIDEAAPYLLNLTLYFQGEPFINPHFFDLVKYAAKKNIYTITSTNGHFLTPENCQKLIRSGLNRLIISIDGISQESYQKYRKGGNLHTVLQGVKNLVEAKKEANTQKPYVILQFLVLKTNEHQIPKLKKMAKQLEIDKLKLKTAQFYNYENGNPLMPTNLKYSRYKKVNGKYVLKNPMKNKCWRSWTSPVITFDGNLVPCCFDKDAQYAFGNVYTEGLRQVFANEKSANFRKQILKNRKDIDICTNCSEGSKIWN